MKKNVFFILILSSLITVTAYSKGLVLKDDQDLPEGTLKESLLQSPDKEHKPLIKRVYRPQNYEAPLEYLTTAITPNDKFYIRGHIPPSPVIKEKDWKLVVNGEGLEKTLEINYQQLTHDYKPVEIYALSQCSGNRRGLFHPHVPGVEWAKGAMGNAKWKGVRLKDILEKAGIKKEALEVVLDGNDVPSNPGTPDFVKSIPMSKALDDDTIVAFEMNGKKIPHLNGGPVKLVVPGWTATYWTKWIINAKVVTKPFDGFWIKTAYRIPKGKFPVSESFKSQEAPETVPITEMVVNSMITTQHPGDEVKAGKNLNLRGFAWDGGHGIKKVELSIDEGKTWSAVELGKDMGKYAWREFSYKYKPTKGKNIVMVKATNNIDMSQPDQYLPNPAGYHHNAIQKLELVGL